MLLPIALAAALVATEIPAARGGQPEPLHVASEVAGAVAQVKYRDRARAIGYAECVAPCTLFIPAGSPFALAVQAPDGRLLAHERPVWRPGGLFKVPYSEVLFPASITARAP